MKATVALAVVRIDGGTQPRTAISEETVANYAEHMRAMAPEFPPIDVFFDGVEYWLADGFHRYHAAQRIGREELKAAVHTGTRRDAVLFAACANQAHGLQRTNADKRKAVVTLLEDDEWRQWSNREIARRLGVDHSFVGDVRAASLLVANSESTAPPRKFTTKHGTEASMRVENIGKKSKAQQQIADYEAKKAMAVEGATQASLRKFQRKSDAEIIINAMQALDGIAGALGLVDPETVQADPRAPEWRATIDNVMRVLRALNRQLERKSA